MIPFFLYSTIVLSIMILHGWNTIENWIIKGWGNGYALWFIPVLFLASLLVKAIYNLREKQRGTLFFSCVAIILFVGIDLHHCLIRLPWALSTVPYAAFMIILGSEWRNLDIKLKNMKSLSFAVFAFFVVAFVSHYWRMDLCFNRILPSLPLTVGAVAGTYMIFVISCWIADATNKIATFSQKVLTRIGRETYIVVAFSPIVIMLMNNYLSLNPVVKYVLLVGMLVVVCFIKNIIITLWENIVKK